MVPTMKKEEYEKMLEELNNTSSYYNNYDNSLNRARSLVAGTAFGGSIEVTMRTDSNHIHAILQPAEVVEFIHSLAGSIGCNVQIEPRQDFATWRKWSNDLMKKSESEGILVDPNPYTQEVDPEAVLATKGKNYKKL